MNNLDKQYQELLKTILEYGVDKKDRTGTGTKSIFGYTVRHNMKNGFPLLTTKKMYWKGIVTELLWFLRGDTNIRYLVDNDCHIWDGDAYKAYQSGFKEKHYLKPTSTKEEFIERIKTDDEFAKKWGDLGPVYGKQWRDWQGFRQGWNSMADTEYSGKFNTKGTDQIKNLIEQLQTNPDSRRLMVNAWNVGDLDKMTLPPCHYGFQVYTRELTFEERQELCEHDVDSHIKLDSLRVPKRMLSLMWNQRSVDTFLGLPFNIASYGLLLKLISQEVNMVPGELIGNLGDVHLYNNHIEQAKEQLTKEPMELPKVKLGNLDLLLGYAEVSLEDYNSHSPIKAPLSN